MYHIIYNHVYVSFSYFWALRHDATLWGSGASLLYRWNTLLYHFLSGCLLARVQIMGFPMLHSCSSCPCSSGCFRFWVSFDDVFSLTGNTLMKETSTTGVTVTQTPKLTSRTMKTSSTCNPWTWSPCLRGTETRSLRRFVLPLRKFVVCCAMILCFLYNQALRTLCLKT